ncbi:DNA polymerase III subunit beta [Fimbriimonas ginsengisoli]|uniref:Beta sliding clamp n=1 Tax=Fimbriimonas ginsengisoli Gsoil 348 TaxID=661478 RepID=A0A068NX27_FIMGI|nr:DNA polymerase III subunit beta [Fimbriimonas ginsengisoli]AIE87991.1 DNA polymerase III subunit beta [Fimbriimonas ginsengisoli Gsoil 348]
MKFDCPRKEFFEAVSAAAAAASVRTSVNILQNLKIEADGGGIRVMGCDGEMWVERDVACMVSEPGAICVPARLLNDLVSSLPDGDTQLRTLEGNAVMLQQGASEYRMVSLDPADFPEPPAFGGDGELRLKMGVLRNAVDSVAYAVSSDFHRQVLTGVLFTYDGRILTLVATDTHRLAVRRLEQEGIGSSVNVVVPEKALKAIKGLPVNDDAEVAILFGGGRVGVEAGGAKVISQLLAGTYPNWERVVPNESTRVWSVEADQLEEKVRRTMILARDNANRVRFKGAGDQILIAARSEEKGEAKEEVDMVSQNGEVEIAFNGKYVQDALQPIEGPGVRIEMTESSRPAVFRPADDETGYFCVIMPMALA